MKKSPLDDQLEQLKVLGERVPGTSVVRGWYYCISKFGATLPTLARIAARELCKLLK